ncbi:hypothetical protein BBH88_06060 [Planococcus antarcticus DSM 14505]|uniref:Apea-like HEPN domain-containing protein n=1 Tax=Planococcus antarcticus DSM 14505 TaxID=1185653 RepID=A0ABM6D419_9BACL|nr:hypothetical protein [Planococcus antarcticus]ANU09892.1 hypothetical protein BBH88_06060 [Planococcus antarcticus DSM 14505]
MFPKDIIQEFLSEMSRQDVERKALIASVVSNSIFNFEMPKMEFPIIEVDYDRVKKIINKNSKYGWTLTQEIDFSYYFKDELVDSTFNQIDNHFLNFYSDNDWNFYHHTKNLILETINPKWTELLNECFDNFEQDRYKSIIPTLFSIIEGETAFIYQTTEAGKDLFETMKTETRNIEHELTKLTIYSLAEFLRWQLFGYQEFSKSRKSLINRNRVLHGRDDPIYWHKVDALRLINILSTVQLYSAKSKYTRLQQEVHNVAT